MSNVIPIPARTSLFAEPAGRAGDWWEPIEVSAAYGAAELNREAERCRLPIDLVYSLLVERALIEEDIAVCALDTRRARTALNDAAHTTPALGPGCLHTSYVRMLRSGESDYERESEEQLAGRDLLLPLRLHESARSLDLRNVCKTASLKDTLAWEIAAASNGQFMREWALRVLLATFSA